MKNLYAPWRDHYTTASARKNQDGESSKNCAFCSQIDAQQDEQHFIIKRFTHHVVMLNLYPYNAGHLLVVPCAHVAHLTELDVLARTELMEIATLCTAILTTVLEAQGINIGLNLGKIAGAGIPSHVHLHVLPRFAGDTNFMPTLAGTKVISFDLPQVYQQLREAFELQELMTQHAP